jgi:ABC-type cobalamin transport system ATPase subunit
LDVEGRAVLDEVLQSAALDGRTVLLASHELDRARALAHREVTLIAGQADGAVSSPSESNGPSEETKETVGT